jgi:hypothetical protein
MNEMTEKERMLWKQAKKRVEFKRHLWTYIIINGFLWALWLFGGMDKNENEFMPWPIWPTLGWGIGIVFNYFGAYHSDKAGAVEREYEKLKNRQ